MVGREGKWGEVSREGKWGSVVGRVSGGRDRERG